MWCVLGMYSQANQRLVHAIEKPLVEVIGIFLDGFRGLVVVLQDFCTTVVKTPNEDMATTSPQWPWKILVERARIV